MFDVHIEYVDGSNFDNHECTSTRQEILKDIYESSDELEPRLISIVEVSNAQ